MSIWLGILHGIDFVCASLLLGGLVFETCIVPAGGISAVELGPLKSDKLMALAGLSLLSSLVWFFFLAADMAGSWSFSDLQTVLFQTDFGSVWMLKIFLLAFILGTLKLKALRWSTGLALSLPIFFSLTGHAHARDSGLELSLMMDFVHFFAVSVWTGGLLGLFVWLGKRREQLSKSDPSASSYRVVHRFSRWGMVSTGLIVLTGLAMAYRYGVAPRAPWESHYGRVLLLKVGLFSMALLVASVNQFVHLSRWRMDSDAKFLKSVRREVGLEILLVLGAFLVAGFLTRSALPGS